MGVVIFKTSKEAILLWHQGCQLDNIPFGEFYSVGGDLGLSRGVLGANNVTCRREERRLRVPAIL